MEPWFLLLLLVLHMIHLRLDSFVSSMAWSMVTNHCSPLDIRPIIQVYTYRSKALSLQGGPLPAISRVITPLIGVIIVVTHLYGHL